MALVHHGGEEEMMWKRVLHSSLAQRNAFECSTLTRDIVKDYTIIARAHLDDSKRCNELQAELKHVKEAYLFGSGQEDVEIPSIGEDKVLVERMRNELKTIQMEMESHQEDMLALKSEARRFESREEKCRRKLDRTSNELMELKVKSLRDEETISALKGELGSQKDHIELMEKQAQKDRSDMMELSKQHDDDQVVINTYSKELQNNAEMLNNLNDEVHRILELLQQERAKNKALRGKKAKSSEKGGKKPSSARQRTKSGNPVTFGSIFSGILGAVAGELEIEDEDGEFEVSKGTDTIPESKIRLIDADEHLVFCAKYNFHGNVFITGGYGGAVRVWDSHTGMEAKSYSGAHKTITAVDISNNGSFVMGGGYDTAVHVWNYANAKNVYSMMGHSKQVCSAFFTFDSKSIITGSHDRTLKLWDLEKGLCSHTFNCRSRPNSVCMTSRSLLCSAHHDKTVRLYDIRTKSEVGREMGHRAPVTCVCISPSSAGILSSSRDHTLKLWDLRHTFKPTKTFSNEHYRNGLDYSKCCFSGGGKYVVAGGTNGEVFLWDVSKGKLHTRLKGRERVAISGVSWCPATPQIIATHKNAPHLTVWE